ncbi:MAG: hypothetical protein JSV44_01385 [Candidatus Zixiibacteriota bacterium]|nr:MAG: hypothetical protein JSV44_01385 [candidate division Zixibacteria bacterium]
MKSHIFLAFLALAIFGPGSSASGEVIIDSTNYRLTLEDLTGSPASIVKMPVNLKNAIAIGSFLLRLEYDTTLLSPVEIGQSMGSIRFDSLEVVDRGIYTILIDSTDGSPPWDTIYNIQAIHDPADDSVNAGALFIIFLPSVSPGGLPELWSRPHLPIHTGEPSAILELLFKVNPGAPPGVTGEVLIKNYVGQYIEYRVVQLGDTTDQLTIYPGLGPLYASALFTVGPVLCGDVDGDWAVDLLDILYLIDFLYGSPAGPPPIQYAADVNSDDHINLLDILFLIDYKYSSPPGPDPDCPS